MPIETPSVGRRVIFHVGRLLHRVRTPFGVLFVVFTLITTIFGSAYFGANTNQAYAAPTNNLNFQARLQTASGGIVPDGFYNIQFNLYDVNSGGSSLWTETYLNSATQGIRIKNGYFSANLGSVAAFPGTINWDEELWLGMTVRGTASCAFGACTPADAEMTPRFKLTAVPYAFKAAQAANVQSASTNAASVNSNGVSVVSGNATGSTSNSGNILIDSGTATGTAGQLLFGTNNTSGILLGRTGINTTVQGSLTVDQNSNLNGDITLGNASTDTLTVNANANFTGNLSITAGDTFTNAGSSVFTAITIADDNNGGVLGGNAAATVDIATTLNVNQTTATQTFTLASPTTTTAGRIIYVNNIGSTSFTLDGNPIAMGKSSSYIWNGTAWVQTISFTSTGVDTVGNIDGGSYSANGASIAGGTIYLQTASATQVGLINTGAQTLAGAKTFTSQLKVDGSSDQNQLVIEANATQTTPLVVFQNSSGTELARINVSTTSLYFGNVAGGSNASGANNTGIGASALGAVSTGTANTTLGSGALASVSVNSGNTAVGYNAGNLVTGTGNVLFGYQAGDNITTGSNNIVLGYDLNAASAVGNNQLNIGGLLTSSDYTLGGTWNGTLAVTGLTTLNGGLTVEAGDTFTFNGDALTDLTGSGLTISSGALTVDNTSATGFFRNGGNAFTAASTLGNTGNYDLNFMTNNAARLTVEADGDVSLAAGLSLRVTGGNTASRPASPTEGMVYFDTDTDRLMTYSNGKWQTDSRESILVAASNSSQADKDAADYVADGNTGAAADGDQVQINAALTAASGRKVVLLAGTYVADATILVPNNTTLAGVGMGTVIEWADIDATDNLIENSDTTTGTGVVIRDMKLDGRNDLNTVNSQYGILFNAMGTGSGNTARRGATITGLYMTRFRSIPIYLFNSANTTVSFNEFKNNGDVSILNQSSINVSIIGNIINSNTWDGIWSDGTGTIISQNTIYGGFTAIFVAGNYTAITGNTISDAIGYGMDIESDYNTITGNTIKNSDNGISIFNSGNTVSGNNIYNSGGATGNDGIYISNGDNNSITGNTITDTSCTTTCYAIWISNAGAQNNYLADNVFSTTSGTATINDTGTDTRYGGQTTAQDGLDTLFKQTNSATAFQVQSSTGGNGLTVNTSTLGVSIGGTLAVTGNTTLTGDLAVNGDDITSDGDLTITPAGGDTNIVGNLFVTTDTYIGAGATATSCQTVSLWAAGCNVQLGNYQSNNTATSNNSQINLDNTIIANPASISSANYYGAFNGAYTASGNTQNLTGILSGQYGMASHQGSGTLATAYGGFNEVDNSGGGTITSARSSFNYLDNYNTGSTITNGYGVYNSINNSIGTTTLLTGTYNKVEAYGAGSITTAVGTDNLITLTSTGTIANAYGTRIQAATDTGAGSITSLAGIAVDEQAVATNNTNLLIGTTTIPAGQFSIYNSSTDDNVFAGNLRVGSTAAPTVALDVTGAAAISNTLAVTGLTTLNGGLTVETGDTFTFNGDAITDLTGSGLIVSSNALTVDNTSSTGFFRNGGNAFTAASTLGNTGSYDLNFMTNNAARLTVEADGDVAFDTNTLFVDAANNRVGIGTTAPTADLSFGAGATRTINVLAQTTSNTAGNGLTLQSGTGNGTGIGGTLTLQGGTGGATNANGGNVAISGGAGSGTGVLGLVTLAPTQFLSSGSTQTFAANGSITGVDSFSTVAVNASTANVDVTVPVPNAANQVVGRILYVSAVNGTNDFDLILSGTSVSISMKANSTATLIWNGTGWTAAGASSSTDLQAAYNNTLSSAGGAEIVLNNTASANGLTVRNNATTPIIGAIFEAQTSIGSNLFSVNNNATEYATNGGAETQGASASTFPANTWSAAPGGGTVDRYTTLGDYVNTGVASVRIQTSATADHGTSNRLSQALVPNQTYSVSFAVRGATNFNTLKIEYSRDGTTTGLTSCAASQIVTSGGWTRID
ncbi:MAG: right-handed parallel beta-helix repeat-containing protein, partial [bacterium]|nr:right-handed parallel beta-helix repeat-containing protein [bacterium]